MLERYVVKQNKRLRCGYTTGSCAAAAAKAAAELLLGGENPEQVELLTPKGILLTLTPEDCRRGETWAGCAIRKDGGDDPDATNGILVYARVEQDSGSEILIDGGTGVGRITLPGLEQPVGAAAINRVPRAMIRNAVEEICEAYDYRGGLRVVISVPQGEEIAKKTFNPRLGIQGGISILGTTGIVEPMSETALIKSIEVEMGVRLSQGNGYVVVIPGNYGTVFSQKEFALDTSRTMKCSNFIGETIDFAVNGGAKGILLIGHIGKFIKLSGGIMNTHSRNADSRMELLCTAALRAGAPVPVLKEILEAATTDEGLKILVDHGYLEASMRIVMEKIAFYLNHRCLGAIETEAMMFSNLYGLLGETPGARAMLEKFRDGTEETV